MLPLPQHHSFISVSILAFDLRSKRRRRGVGQSLTTQQGGSAFVELLFLRNKINQPNLQKKKSLNKCEQAVYLITWNLTQAQIFFELLSRNILCFFSWLGK